MMSRDPLDIWIERKLIAIGEYFLPKVRNLFKLNLSESDCDKRKRKPGLLTWEEDEILEAASAAVNHHIISVDELIDGIRLLGKLSDKGIKPQDFEDFYDYSFYEKLKLAAHVIEVQEDSNSQ